MTVKGPHRVSLRGASFRGALAPYYIPQKQPPALTGNESLAKQFVEYRRNEHGQKAAQGHRSQDFTLADRMSKITICDLRRGMFMTRVSGTKRLCS